MLDPKSLERFFSQRHNWQQGSTRLPPLHWQSHRPALVTPLVAPCVYRIGGVLRPRDLMPNFRLTEHSDCSSSQTELLRKRDIRGLGQSPDKSAGGPVGSALRAGLHRLRSKHHRRLLVRLRIGRADTPQNLQSPRARVIARLKRSLPMQKSVYVLPPRASFLVSDLYRFGDPATRPPGPSPASRLSRVNQHAAVSPPHTAPLFRSLRLSGRTPRAGPV